MEKKMKIMEQNANYGDNEAVDHAYIIKGILGKGGFGVVYSGVRVHDGLLVAIKEVPICKVLKWTTLGDKNVPLELRLLLACQSVAGVVRLIDWCLRGDYFLYIMEYSPHCRDLFDYISHKGALGKESLKSYSALS